MRVRRPTQFKTLNSTFKILVALSGLVLTLPCVSQAKPSRKQQSVARDVTIDLGSQSYVDEGDLRCSSVLLRALKEHPKANRFIVEWHYVVFGGTVEFRAVYNRQKCRLFYQRNAATQAFYKVTVETLDAVAKAGEPITMVDSHGATKKP
jgi:hypothetical protein